MYNLNNKKKYFYFNLVFGKFLDNIDYKNYLKNSEITNSSYLKQKKNKFKSELLDSNLVTRNFFTPFKITSFFRAACKVRVLSFLLIFAKRSIVAFAYFQILKQIKKKNVLITFDCSVTPASFGDFFYFIMFARFFQILKKNIFFVIISGEYRSNWPRFKNKKKILSHIKFMKKIIRLFLNNKNLKIKEVKWDQFQQEYIKNENFFLIPFKNRVFSRNRIYFHTHNFLVFSYQYNKKIFKKLLLSKKDYLKVNVKKFNKPYICFHSSHPNRVSAPKDITSNEFILIIKKLNQIYKKYKVVVVSEKSGCEFFKKIANKNKLECLFSKDVSFDIMSDIKLIMQSKAYFQYKGGGIGNPILYSNHPSIAMWHAQNKKENIVLDTNNLLPPGKYTQEYPWLNKNQFIPLIYGVNNYLKFLDKHKII